MDKDLKELSEKLDGLRAELDDLEEGLLAQIRVENIALGEMLHLLWGIAQQGLGACTVLSELGRDIGNGAQAKVNKAWVDAQKRLDMAEELSHQLNAAVEIAAKVGGESDEPDEA